jgi:hypothetical protein
MGRARPAVAGFPGDHAAGLESEAQNWAHFARTPGLDRAHEDINLPALLDLRIPLFLHLRAIKPG